MNKLIAVVLFGFFGVLGVAQESRPIWVLNTKITEAFDKLKVATSATESKPNPEAESRNSQLPTTTSVGNWNRAVASVSLVTGIVRAGLESKATKTKKFKPEELDALISDCDIFITNLKRIIDERSGLIATNETFKKLVSIDELLAEVQKVRTLAIEKKASQLGPISPTESRRKG